MQCPDPCGNANEGFDVSVLAASLTSSPIQHLSSTSITTGLVEEPRTEEERKAANALAGRISAGDPAAEAELVSRYERAVLQILKCCTYDLELARDLCQETFVVVLRRLRSAPLSDPGRLAGFIAQTARNLFIASRRQTARRRTTADTTAVDSAIDEGPSREQQAEADSAATIVRKLLAELKLERDRVALVRFYLNEEAKETICTDLALTELQFNQILFRARARMRELLERRGLRQRDLLCMVLA
jgi:RNA polymerase sigma factor (sigma-70 family)